CDENRHDDSITACEMKVAGIASVLSDLPLRSTAEFKGTYLEFDDHHDAIDEQDSVYAPRPSWNAVLEKYTAPTQTRVIPYGIFERMPQNSDQIGRASCRERE